MALPGKGKGLKGVMAMGRHNGRKSSESRGNEAEFKRAWYRSRYGIELTTEEKTKLMSISKFIKSWWIVRDTDGALWVSAMKPVYDSKLKQYTVPFTCNDELPFYLPTRMIPALYTQLGPLKVGFLMTEDALNEAI